jgi:uncharacterized protein (DUF169 family)
MVCSELQYLEHLTGTQWSGIRFCQQCFLHRQRSSALCQAIARSFSGRLCLSSREMDCPGALRALGVYTDDEKITAHIAQEAAADPQRVAAIVARSPRMRGPVEAVELGDLADPELCIGYIAPEKAMELLRKWQTVYASALAANLSSFMAICSAVTGAYINNTLVFSLGCPESRKKGAVAPGMLVAVMPRAMVTGMMQEVTECRHVHTDAVPAGKALCDFNI